MFFDVKTAIERTGKSQFTINSLCKKYSDTSHIKRENGKYLIESKFLFSHYPERTTTGTKPPEPELLNITSETTSENINITSDYIKTLENQLKEKDKTISELIERIRELNIILQTSQQKSLAAHSDKKNLLRNLLRKLKLIEVK